MATTLLVFHARPFREQTATNQGTQPSVTGLEQGRQKQIKQSLALQESYWTWLMDPYLPLTRAAGP